jgi:hypothetical protein
MVILGGGVEVLKWWRCRVWDCLFGELMMSFWDGSKVGRRLFIFFFSLSSFHCSADAQAYSKRGARIEEGVLKKAYLSAAITERGGNLLISPHCHADNIMSDAVTGTTADVGSTARDRRPFLGRAS